MELLTVVFRTMFFYFFVVLMYRIMGKRELAQLSIIDLIVSILIAELVAISIENKGDSIYLTIVPILILVGLEILLAFLSLKFRWFRSFISGKATPIIIRGKICYKQMVDQRYTLDDLLLELRQKSIKNINDVEYAFLESNGKLSIFKYNLINSSSSYPIAVIIDGEIQKESLKNIGKSKTWLIEHLNQKKLNPDDIFYAFYQNKKLDIILKSNI